MEIGLTLLTQASMSLYYWWEAFHTAVYLINRLPSTVLKNKLPFHVLFSKISDCTTLKRFSCACYPNLRPYNQHKLSFHTTKCVFLGYSNQHKGYRCFSSTGRLYISHHVIFNEDDFPYQHGFINKKQPEISVSHLPILPITDFNTNLQ